MRGRARAGYFTLLYLLVAVGVLSGLMDSKNGLGVRVRVRVRGECHSGERESCVPVDDTPPADGDGDYAAEKQRRKGRSIGWRSGRVEEVEEDDDDDTRGLLQRLQMYIMQMHIL
jgi:hypothetical protein